MAPKMRHLCEVCRLVGDRLLAVAVSPTQDPLASIFALLLLTELGDLCFSFFPSKRIQSKVPRRQFAPLPLQRSAFGFAGILWAALLGRRLTEGSGISEEPYLLIILLAWLLLVLRSDAVWTQSDHAARFRAAQKATRTCLLFNILILLYMSERAHSTIISLNYASFAFLVSILWLAFFLSVSRGPNEFLDSRPVDREQNCSLFERLTFSWSLETFSFKSSPSLDIKMLPTLREELKAKHHGFADGQSGMVKALALKHAPSLVLQWILAVLDSFLVLAPDLATYKLLHWLGHDGGGARFSGVLLALLLGGTKIASVTTTSWLKWITASKVLIPIQSSMNAMIYQKALRMSPASSFAPMTPAVTGQSLLEMRSCCTNACAFFTDLHEVVVVLTKLIVATTLLLKLLGWQCLIAGIVVTAISMPLSTLVARHYSKTLAATTRLHEEQSAILSQALLCIRQIKISAEEKMWKNKMNDARTRELENIMLSAIWMTLLVLADDLSPILLSGVPVYVFTLLGNPLSSSVAFTSIGMFKEVQSAMSALPMILPYIWNYWCEVQRLEMFLASPELGQHITSSEQVSLKNSSLTWSFNSSDEKTFILEDICVDFPDGELSLITGQPGSGKSLLLASIAGEACLLSGKILRPTSEKEDSTQDHGPWLRRGDTAFVTQNVWMSNDTIQENILFGAPFDDSRYRAVLHACALEKDLSTFENRDDTIVGINGATLSGGQRWRIALARALYSRAMLLLFDDVLSAVDAEVREWIIEKALCGELAAGRTRILATHHDRQIIERAACQVHLADKKATIHISAPVSSAAPKATSQLSGPPSEVLTRSPKRPSHVPTSHTPVADSPCTKKVTKSLQKNTYRNYFDVSGGGLTWVAALLTILASEAMTLYASWWLKLWTSSDAALGTDNDYIFSPAAMYMILSLFSCLISAVRCFVWYVVGVKASKTLSSVMIDHIFGANLQWLESTSHGEILTVIGEDMEQVDDRLPHALGFVIENVFSLAFIIFTNASFSLYEAPFVAILFYIFVATGLRLLSAQRGLKILQDTTVSAIQQHLSSLQAPDGIGTVRSYGMADSFTSHMHRMLDDRFSVHWNFSLCNTMIGFQFGILGALYVTLSSLFIVFAGPDAGSAGIALSFASKLGGTVGNTLKRMSAVESDLQSVQKIMQYRAVNQESLDGADAPSKWPSRGAIRVQNLTVGYGGSSNDTLTDLSFSINASNTVDSSSD